jgi:uncharacterized membrane protein YdjX (TVP38/TMEM64 family)
MDLPSFKNNAPRFALLALLVLGAGTFFVLMGHHGISFERLISNKNALIDLADSHPVIAPVAFVSSYLILGFFGLPGSTVLNLTAGLLFDFWKGLMLVLLASTLASLLAFVSFRYLFRNMVEVRVRKRFPKLEEDLQREGAYFVFAMRLFPVIPYSFTNLVLAISPVKLCIYLVVTLVAMFPRYLLYVYAGAHLGNVRHPDDLISPSLALALAILAVLPWALKAAAPRIQRMILKKELPS